MSVQGFVEAIEGVMSEDSMSELETMLVEMKKLREEWVKMADKAGELMAGVEDTHTMLELVHDEFYAMQQAAKTGIKACRSECGYGSFVRDGRVIQR